MMRTLETPDATGQAAHVVRLEDRGPPEDHEEFLRVRAEGFKAFRKRLERKKKKV